MSDIRASTEVMQEISTQTVPSLFQLALTWISDLSLWSFAQDIPETAVPGLLKKIKHTNFDLDLLPNLLPASLQHLDLTGYFTLTEDTLLVIIKKCFCLSSLILNDVPSITQHIVPQIFWHLPDLTYLSLGAGVGSLAMLEIVQKPIKLVRLEINSALMDEMWLEQLRYFPDLVSLKLRNVTIPKIQSVSFKLPTHLASVNISTTENQKTDEKHVNLFKYFLENAPNLQEFVCYSSNLCEVKAIGPIVAKDMRILRTRGVKLSKTVIDAICDTCQNLEHVEGLFRMIEDNKVELIGERTLGSKVSYIYTNKKLNYDLTQITSGDGAWKEGPDSFYAPLLSVFSLPIDPCPTLRTLTLSGGTYDIINLLQLFPNLEHLSLSSLELKMEKKQADPTQILGYYLKSLDIVSIKVPAGAIDLFTRSPSLKKVSLTPARIPEFKLSLLNFDVILKKFPFVKTLRIEADLTPITISNNDVLNSTGSNPDIEDHPLAELTFIRLTKRSDGSNPEDLTLMNIDFNRYKNLESLRLDEVYLDKDVKLHTRLRVLIVDDVHGLYKESFHIPLTLFHLKWKSNITMWPEVFEAVKKMKYLRYFQGAPQLQHKIQDMFGDAVNCISSLGARLNRKYYLPRRTEVSKTNLLSAFTGIKKETSPMEKLPALLASSGSNLTMKEVQLIAEMYSKQEISLRSDEPVVHVKIRLTSGAIMNINCNPSHRVIELYAYARHAVKLGDKAFDLVVPPKTILDLSTYDKTLKELRLVNTTLIQKLREATPVENELRNFGLFHSQLINFGKNKSDSLNESTDQTLKRSNSADINNNNNMTTHNDDAMSDQSDESVNESENEDDDENSDIDDDADSMEVDDDGYMDMYYAEKVEKKEEITGENKYLLDQMNAEAMRQSREYRAQKEHEAQKEREEREKIRREEVRRKFEDEQKKMDAARRWGDMRYNQLGNMPSVHQNYRAPPQPVQFVPAEQPNPLNNGFMTDEEMARMLQEQEYDQVLDEDVNDL